MIDRTTKLRWRRLFRRRRKQVEQITEHAEQRIDEHVIQRLASLTSVYRFVAGWLVLLVLLGGTVLYQYTSLGKYYQVAVPQAGGTFTEGVLGQFNTANPLYASTTADTLVSKLVFSGLFRYNDRNKLVGDLAASLTADENGTKYTAVLRDNLFWHDGTPVTASDVLFTYSLIQNPDARSALNSSWRGVTITKSDDKTIVFSLPNTLSSFPHSLTNGILPQHILRDIEPSQLRSSSFNTRPIGTGPFVWQSVRVEGDSVEARESRVNLAANQQYHAGVPKLDNFNLRIFIDQDTLINSFKAKEINSIAGLQRFPETLEEMSEAERYSFPITGATYLFLKNSSPALSTVEVRKALLQATDTDALLSALGYPVKKVDSIFLRGKLGYDPQQRQFDYDLNAANQALDAVGWVKGSDGIRTKDGQPLQLTLVTLDNNDYRMIAQAVQSEWQKIGVGVSIISQPEDVLQSNHVIPHSYDVLLYGIGIGADPDIFAYWHSSQADIKSVGRLNLSEWKNQVADQALEGGRTRLDSTLRAAKYKPLAEVWKNDVPAIGLYQPMMLYITNSKVFNMDVSELNSTSDRYSNVHNWMIREANVVRGE